MRAFTFIMFLCLLCSLSGYAAREKGEIMLFPKSERAVAKSEKKYLEFCRNLNKGVLMYEVKFEEKKQWIERPASEMGKLGERSRKAGNGKIEVLKKVRVKTRGKKVVLVGFKKPLATGEIIKVTVKKIGVYERTERGDGDTWAVYQYEE